MDSLTDQIKTANEGIKSAATTSGDALSQALTFALNGDAPKCGHLDKQRNHRFCTNPLAERHPATASEEEGRNL